MLTDGQPNYMCPQQGYVPKIEPILDNLYEQHNSAPTIHTFGFGSSIRSDLMLSIAKAGNGSYAFMPDVGMIGTVFVHAVANLYATYATNAVLEISIPNSRTEDLQHRSGLTVQRPDPYRLTIDLGNIMFGQSRDLIVSYSPNRVAEKTDVNAIVTYQPHSRPCWLNQIEDSASVFVTSNLGQAPTIPRTLLDYHTHRTNLCRFLASLYPIDDVQHQHKTRPLASIKDASPCLRVLLEQLVAVPGRKTDPNLNSLLSDLVGPTLNPETLECGQIYQALQTSPRQKGIRVFKSYWEIWGRHYLPSLWCAHMRQTCNSFKDAGPLRYGVDSELFKRCRDELDEAFDNLPPPVGTYVGTISQPYTYSRDPRAFDNYSTPCRAPISMARWNRSDNTCFLNSCRVNLANGASIKVEDLRPGMKIHNPLQNTAREVVGIVKAVTASSSSSSAQEICRVGADLWLTPWHPVYSTTLKKWVFPHDIAEERRLLQSHEAVYSIILTPDADADSHALEVGGITCATLGHGITTQNTDSDVRAHPFFGNYRRVLQNLTGLSVDKHGRWLCGGVIRDADTGLICGVLGASALVDQCAREDSDGTYEARMVVSRL